MSRLAAQAKAEFYPTPPSVVDEIAKHIKFQHQGKRALYRILDPCAGAGAAVARLAEQLAAAHPQLKPENLQTWGIELHPGRAAKATERLDKVLPGSLETMHWSPAHGAANLLFLNPPYDWSETANARVETYFLNRSSQALVPGGVLIYIVPVSALRDWQMNTFLARNYQHLQVYRFGDEEYARFKQLVILGVRRQQPVRRAQVRPTTERLRMIGAATLVSALGAGVSTRKQIYQL